MSYWRNVWLEKSSLRMCPNCLVGDTPLLFGWGSAHSGSALGGEMSVKDLSLATFWGTVRWRSRPHPQEAYLEHSQTSAIYFFSKRYYPRFFSGS